MRFLRKLLIFVAILLIAELIIGFLLPSNVHIEATEVINAETPVVFNQVNDFKNWEKWSPWKEMDETMKISYDAKTTGKDAKYSWTSEKQGEGYMVIKESNPNSSIKTYVNFGPNGEGTGQWKFEPQGDKTKVTWGFDSDMGKNPFSKLMGTVMMKLMVGKSLRKGLANIKELSEA